MTEPSIEPTAEARPAVERPSAPPMAEPRPGRMTEPISEIRAVAAGDSVDQPRFVEKRVGRDGQIGVGQDGAGVDDRIARQHDPIGRDEAFGIAGIGLKIGRQDQLREQDRLAVEILAEVLALVPDERRRDRGALCRCQRIAEMDVRVGLEEVDRALGRACCWVAGSV
jgi:hypothetical protein